MNAKANPKDLFSGHAQLYASYRPTYPEQLYHFIFDLVKEKNAAWDCATGNGQIARRLADTFKTVYASDISKQQLQHAPSCSNVHYSIQRAEQTNYRDASFDLITVGQALHWFDIDKFYKEVYRVGKPGGLLAVWGYSHLAVSQKIDNVIQDYYYNTVGKYWDPARRLVEDKYQSIMFPFQTYSAPEISIRVMWTTEHLQGYLESWSATQAYIHDQHYNPVPDLMKSITPIWPDNEKREVLFPLFVKAGRI
jgi:ubiquinone/menaquinone biosynthesis C-methylase UbiE